MIHLSNRITFDKQVTPSIAMTLKPQIDQEKVKITEPPVIPSDFVEALSKDFVFQSVIPDPQFSLEAAFRHQCLSVWDFEPNDRIGQHQFEQFTQDDCDDYEALNQRLFAAKKKMELKDLPLRELENPHPAPSHLGKVSTIQGLKRLRTDAFDRLPAETRLFVFHHEPNTLEQKAAAESL